MITIFSVRIFSIFGAGASSGPQKGRHRQIKNRGANQGLNVVGEGGVRVKSQAGLEDEGSCPARGTRSRVFPGSLVGPVGKFQAQQHFGLGLWSRRPQPGSE